MRRRRTRREQLRSRDFTPEPHSIALVRRFVAESVAGDATDAVLVASELATNVVRHARTPFTVSVNTEGTRLEVRDGSSIPPAMGDLLGDAGGGSGLRVVEKLTVRWGVDVTDDGKVVWAELR